jgi:hypothetical protein
MAFTISPSVTIQEQDLASSSVVEVSNYIGATAGFAQWGPAGKPTLITAGVDELISRFYKPNDASAVDLLVAADFLSYSPKMWYTRVIGPNALNAVEGGNNPVLVRNEDESQNGNFSGTQFIAKYPGSLGNGLVIDIADTAKFANWEFRNSFDYAPAVGEFAIAIVDGSGAFSGQGRTRQTERLTVYNKASGGIKERRTVTLSGAVTGGVKQVETLAFEGVATGTSIAVNGVAVTVVVGDTAAIVAGKVAAALDANATYDSAVATGANVLIAFAAPGLRAKSVNGNQAGITWGSVVEIAGDDNVQVTLYNRTITSKVGDTASTVATALAQQLALQTNTYDTVSVTGAVITITYAGYGVSTYPLANQVSAGVTATSAITVVGSSDINITVFGATVAIKDKDTPSVVASKIAAALAGEVDFTEVYSGIAADRASVVYTTKNFGKAATKVSPAQQAGMEFLVDIAVAGRLGTLLERFEIQKDTPGAKFPDGTSRYFADAINGSSKYVFVGDKSIGLTADSVTLSGGVDDYNANRINAINEYVNSEKMDINYLWVAGSVIEQKAVGDVIETRRDLVGFFSPMMDDVVNNAGDELAAVTAWRSIELNRDSTYGFNTDNWALVYDRYNDVNRWIPTCGGTAGLLARTSIDFDPWISPAGHQRGRYKNYIRLAWSANKGQRDELYKIGVNSIVDFPNEGILLYGDKTSTSRPTSFSRLNVRQAFIVAEKSIANFAKRYLFELNDEFTRNQFLNAVRPFLRGMVGRRAFEDFRVIADERNNGGAVRAENKMQGKILLKPLYSINYIILDFNAVRPDVTFEEIEEGLGG